MLRLLSAAVLVVLATALTARAATPQLSPQATPAALNRAVADAELWGRKLFESYGVQRALSPLIETAAETAHAAMKTSCPGRYTLVVPDERTDDGILVYELAELRPGTIIIGGQSKVLVSPDGRTALTVTPSAKTCVTLDSKQRPAGQTKVAAFVTHLLSPTPTEFHVLATLHAKLPLFVATSAGAWLVDNGKIQYMGPLDAPQPQ
jgi:hypothetical protein